jgi:hypothetical protein
MRYLSRSHLLAAVSLIASIAVWHAPAKAQDKTQDESGEWQEKAAALVPAGFVAGRAYRVDRETMTGYVAAFPAGSDDVATPGSAFDPGYMVVAKLDLVDGKLTFASGTFTRRTWADTTASENEDYHAAIRNRLTAAASKLPAGTTHVWSMPGRQATAAKACPCAPDLWLTRQCLACFRRPIRRRPARLSRRKAIEPNSPSSAIAADGS